MHVRAALREAAGAALAGIGEIGGRVFVHRVYPLEPEERPGLCVYTTTERASVESNAASAIVRREIELRVEIVVDGSETQAAQADQIAERVEQILGSAIAVTVDGVTTLVPLDYESAFFDLSRDAERAVGTLVLTYRAHVYTEASTPGAFINA